MKNFLGVLLTVALVAAVLLPGGFCKPDGDYYGGYGYGYDWYGAPYGRRGHALVEKDVVKTDVWRNDGYGDFVEKKNFVVKERLENRPYHDSYNTYY